MRKALISLALFLSVLAVVFFNMPMSAQHQQYPFPGFPPEMSPLRTSRPHPKSPPPPATKFVRAAKEGVANQYMITFADGAVTPAPSRAQLRNNVAALAHSLATVNGATIRSVYANGLKGFAANMSESAAIALSQNPKVALVEQDQMLHVQSCQTSAPWDLDRIDEITRTLDGNYCHNADGSGVSVYVLDTGIRATHNDFGSRATNAADYVNESGCTGTNNDCHVYSHGTAVASVIGGSTYGVAKDVTIKSIKVCNSSNPSICYASDVESGLEWAIGDHGDSDIAVANLSIGDFTSTTIDNEVRAAIEAGITCVAAAGNGNTNVYNHSSPGQVDVALTAGASDYYDSRWINSGSSGSNYGDLVDIFAPGFGNVAACNSSNNCEGEIGATSGASPIGAGLVALYLEGRTGMSGCPDSPIDGPANTSGGAVSTCPDRVNQFIKSNASLSQLSNVPGGTANRLAYSGALPTNDNPIDNHRFFVWEHYRDFKPDDKDEPDESGLDWWTGEITGGTGHGHNCYAGVNDNNSCTHDWRILDSRAFWVAVHSDWFSESYGLVSGKNDDFVDACYHIYLRRNPNDPPDNNFDGYNYWVNYLSTQYGDPSNADGVLDLINQFLSSTEYRQRFGEP